MLNSVQKTSLGCPVTKLLVISGTALSITSDACRTSGWEVLHFLQLHYWGDYAKNFRPCWYFLHLIALWLFIIPAHCLRAEARSFCSSDGGIMRWLLDFWPPQWTNSELNSDSGELHLASFPVLYFLFDIHRSA